MQVLVNLTGNAIKFTPEGGKITISACRGQADGEIKVTVEDSGIGIPPDELEKIFEKFYQTKRRASSDINGTGSVSRSSGDRQSPRWQGLGRERRDERRPVHALRYNAGARLLLRRRPWMDDKQIKVLVADDEADFRELMSFWLKSKGYSVITAENGEQAVEQAASQAPDIVFMDLNMPVLDGADALKKLRESGNLVPVIVISAFVDDRKAKEVRKYGISGVFFKGKDFQEGLMLLEAALRTHKQLKNK